MYSTHTLFKRLTGIALTCSLAISMFSTTLQDVHAGMEMTFTDVSESS